MLYDNLSCMVALNKLFSYNPLIARELLTQSASPSTLFNQLGNNDSLTKLIEAKLSSSKWSSPIELLEESQKEVEWALSNNIAILWPREDSHSYPLRLRQCPDHPLLLYKSGNLDLNAPMVLGVVGTRQASDYGKRCTLSIIKKIGEILPGTIIVSGLAYGIDTQAHRAALKYSLPTVAVMGCGAGVIYPAYNYSLAQEIKKSGAIITEFPRNTNGYKINFLRRNRIIAGMSDAILVIESGIKGGSTITASLAVGYNREVFAVPGRVDDKVSAGCNHLIARNRAAIFTTVKEMANQLGWETLPNPGNISQKSLFNHFSAEKEKILVALKGNNNQNIDLLSASVGLPVHKLLALLLELELDGHIVSMPGKRYSILHGT